ncbi:hypothetical protein TPHA_0A03360 [Tetrapisispora phaffii CBS 4417]|uniref:SMP-LTD domain-containing protein n=1 Tax=Tetrapisispora phaffii (strain ATCC 24235 / CBS 4417 / NBRC 1672 / NRRL Y-8282 / UCD 70-5) TaxID=1071381 RepID=G8BND5_TETPH|nr:hypothetical protein TPHA_0A03360 [Tetrapisispora phaffii CBS 4417]CCE61413.1 hypothetical protein TPHA_0A03360 [Tetrapisispora phaffii CBS 4417]
MVGLKEFIFIYLLGGITFIPLSIFVILKLNKVDKKKLVNDNGDDNSLLTAKKVDPHFKLGKILEDEGVNVYKKGWITVTKKYYYHFSEIPSLNIDLNNKESPQYFERSQLKKKHNFFAVLKHGNLFLYKKDDANSDLVYAISLKNNFLTIWPRNPNKEVVDGSLFTKRTCIAILQDSLVEYDLNNDSIKLDEGTINKNNFIYNNNTNETNNSIIPTSPSVNSSMNQHTNSTPSTYYLYFNNNMDKEDWYFQLINASKTSIKNISHLSKLDPSLSANTAHLNTHDTLLLIQNLNSTEGQIHSQWFNALIGRLFLSLQQTDSLNTAIYNSVCKKLSKINKPGFLDDLIVEKVDVGNSAPLITNPKLAALSPDGSTKITCNLLYTGNLSLNIATKVQINLGSRFTQREVSIQLAIKVKEISGPMILIIKPPPSNRIWYAFESNPKLDFDIEPIVSSSKLSYNVIINAIKNKLIEGIQESLVFPFMDDLVFFPTTDEIYRGGIWNKNENRDDSVTTIQTINNNIEDNKSKSTTNNTVSNIDDNLNDDINSISSSFDNQSTKTGNIKQRTLQKVGNLKDTIQYRKSKGSFALPSGKDDNNDAASISSANTCDENGTTKKYFKNSIKKINKWYKDTINNNEEDENSLSSVENANDLKNEKQMQTNEDITNRVTAAVTPEATKPKPSNRDSANQEPTLYKNESINSLTKEELPDILVKEGPPETLPATPIMISNRRRPVPKIPVSINTTMQDSNTVDNNQQQTPTSPISNMFVNYARTRSLSSTSNDFNNIRKASYSKISNPNIIRETDIDSFPNETSNPNDTN